MATYTAFADMRRRLYHGPDPAAAAEAARQALANQEAAHAVVFDDATGALTDVDALAPAADVVARLAKASPWARPAAEAAPAAPDARPAGPGRPKLGVVSREVSLLPRHWDWLGTQPGGASAAIRRLVDEARKRDGGAEAARHARDAAYKAMSTLAGDAPGFEAASRALYAGRLAEARDAVGGPGWHPDVAEHVRGLIDAAARAGASPA